MLLIILYCKAKTPPRSPHLRLLLRVVFQSTLLQNPGGRPGLHWCSSIAGLHQADGVLEGLIQVTSKEPAHC